MVRFKWLSVALFLVGCSTPGFLAKYQSETASTSAPLQSSSPRAGVHRLKEGHYRFRGSFNEIWESAISILIKNYNITILDKENGVITTEWDSFYLDNKLYRNRISIHMTPKARNVIEIFILNNVEVYKSAEGEEQGSGPTWTPSNNGREEVERVVHNMALNLNIDPPKNQLSSAGASEMKESAEKTR